MTGSADLTATGRYAFAEGIEPDVRERAMSFLDRKASHLLGDDTIKVAERWF